MPWSRAGAFPGRALAAVLAPGLGVQTQPTHVRLILRPGDVAFVDVGNQHLPFFSREGLDPHPALRLASRPGAAIGEGSCVAGVVQHPDRPGVAQGPEDHLPLSGSSAKAQGEQELVVAEMVHDARRRSYPPEGLEEVLDGVPDALVRIQHHTV